LTVVIFQRKFFQGTDDTEAGVGDDDVQFVVGAN